MTNSADPDQLASSELDKMRFQPKKNTIIALQNFHL